MNNENYLFIIPDRGEMTMNKKGTLIFIFITLLSISLWSQEIHRAAEKGDIERVKQLLAKDEILLNTRDAFNSTPLHWACMRDHEDICMLLINMGADVNALELHDGGVLHWAAHSDNRRVVEALILKGAVVDKKNRYGRTPLHVTARRGCTEVAKVLIENGADVNATVNDGRTPLHIAAHGGHEGVYNLLLKNGADEEVRDKNGQTPMDLKKPFVKREIVTVDPKLYDSYAGVYQLSDEQGRKRTTRIEKEDNKLFLNLGIVRDEIFPESETKFFSKRELIQVTFIRDESGKVTELIFTSGGRDSRRKKIE